MACTQCRTWGVGLNVRLCTFFRRNFTITLKGVSHLFFRQKQGIGKDILSLTLLPLQCRYRKRYYPFYHRYRPIEYLRHPAAEGGKRTVILPTHIPFTAKTGNRGDLPAPAIRVMQCHRCNYFDPGNELHGGDLQRFVRDNAEGGGARCVELKAEKAGYVTDIDAETVARAAFNLGAGRAKADDSIDMTAGVLLSVAHGDRVEKGQTLARLYAKERVNRLAGEAALLADAFSLSPGQPVLRKMILETVD